MLKNDIWYGSIRCIFLCERCTTTRNVHTIKRAFLPVLRFWSNLRTYLYLQIPWLSLSLRTNNVKAHQHKPTTRLYPCNSLPKHKKATPQIGFQYQCSFNAGQTYCRILKGEHSAILFTFMKLPFVIKIFILERGRLTQVLMYIQLGKKLRSFTDYKSQRQVI